MISCWCLRSPRQNLMCYFVLLTSERVRRELNLLSTDLKEQWALCPNIPPNYSILHLFLLGYQCLPKMLVIVLLFAVILSSWFPLILFNYMSKKEGERQNCNTLTVVRKQLPVLPFRKKTLASLCFVSTELALALYLIKMIQGANLKWIIISVLLVLQAFCPYA